MVRYINIYVINMVEQNKEGKEGNVIYDRQDIIIRVKPEPADPTPADEKKLDDLEKEKEELNKKLLETSKKFDELQKSSSTSAEELEKVRTEKDTYKSKLQEIALNKFNEEKKGLLETLKTIPGYDETRIKELEEKIKTPIQLDSWVNSTKYLSDGLKKAQSERDAAEKAAKEKADKEKADADKKALEDAQKKAANLPGSDPQNPPQGSVATLQDNKGKKWVYDSAMEAVDDLYDRVAKGEKEAQRLLDKMWDVFVPSAKREMGKVFAITACPICGSGVERDAKCRRCGYDPRVWRDKGGEIW